MFGFNKRAQILRPQGSFPGGGDYRTSNGYVEVAQNVPCALQEATTSSGGFTSQQYLPGGQVMHRKSRLWLPPSTDVRENDVVVVDDVRWMVEGVIDEAGRGHHLLCQIERFA